MKNIKYDRFITIISQDKVVGEQAVEATELLINLQKEDLKEKDFELTDAFITVTRTSMSKEELSHIEDLLNYIRTKSTK